MNSVVNSNSVEDEASVNSVESFLNGSMVEETADTVRSTGDEQDNQTEQIDQTNRISRATQAGYENLLDGKAAGLHAYYMKLKQMNGLSYGEGDNFTFADLTAVEKDIDDVLSLRRSLQWYDRMLDMHPFNPNAKNTPAQRRANDLALLNQQKAQFQAAIEATERRLGIRRQA